jgi:hypothetical protein
MSLLKCCKECNSEFTIILPENNRRGSNNCLRKQFCTKNCKEHYNKKKKEGKINKNCKFCKQEFISYKCKNSLFCSTACKNKSQIKLKTKNCLFCTKIYQTKPSRINSFFCSRSCFNNSNREIKECVTCKKFFQNKKSNRHIVRCSRKCQFIDQSNGKIKIHLNGRTGYRTDLGFETYFKSALEADFARFLKFFNIQYEYETKTFITENGAYTPDFFLPELSLFIELKGVENTGKHFEILMTKNLSKKDIISSDVNIITITQKEFIQGLKFAEIWKIIPNLEQRNYKKTKELVFKYEDKNNKNNRT